jgi:hypothetical protein
MLKMRRVWRRTSSSQADPSPWRHCWTSWASCSNVSSASKPATVQGVSASWLSLKSRLAVHLGLPTMERKLLSKCSPWVQGLTADRSARHLTQPSRKTQARESPRDGTDASKARKSLVFSRLIPGSCRASRCGLTGTYLWKCAPGRKMAVTSSRRREMLCQSSDVGGKTDVCIYYVYLESDAP